MAAEPQPLRPFPKLALEFGPLAVFFLGNTLAPRLGFTEDGSIFLATSLFMAATVVALGLSYALARRLPLMPLISGGVVLVFGGLTLLLQDDLFIKVKPTIVNGLFGLILLGGLAFGRPLLPVVLDALFELDDAGWRKLTLRWGVFFLFLGVLNEVVWRSQTRDFWVAFKVFGMTPISVLFALAQTPLILKHEIKREPGAS